MNFREPDFSASYRGVPDACERACGRRTARPHMLSECNASLQLRFSANQGEEPEVELALV